MKFHPHNYQKTCIDAILSRTHVGLYLEMGLG